jgi:hypothetical protein
VIEAGAKVLHHVPDDRREFLVRNRVVLKVEDLEARVFRIRFAEQGLPDLLLPLGDAALELLEVILRALELDLMAAAHEDDDTVSRAAPPP